MYKVYKLSQKDTGSSWFVVAPNPGEAHSKLINHLSNRKYLSATVARIEEVCELDVP